jgi:HD-like signal output (HDOD) protein
MIKNSKNRFNNIIVAIVFGFILFLIIGGWFYYNSLNQTTKEKASEYLASLALNRAEKITGWFSDIEKKTQTIQWYERKENSEKRKNAGRNDEALAKWLKANAEQFRAESASLYDSKKELVLKDKSALINIPDELILDDSHAGERIIFGEVSYIMDRFYMGVLIPLYNGEEKKLPSGYLSFNINLSENLFGEVKPLPGNYRSEEILIMPGKRESYTLLIDLKEKKIIIPDLPDSDKDTDRSIFQSTGDGNRLVSGADQAGKQVSASIAEIKGTNWSVITKADISEIEEPVIAERFKIVLFIAVVSIIFLLTAYFLIKPKKKLRPAAVEESAIIPEPDAAAIIKKPEETGTGGESKNTFTEIEPEPETKIDFMPEPAEDLSRHEIEIPDEYKNVLLHIEPKIEKSDIESSQQGEVKIDEETLPVLPETEVIEETVIDVQTEEAETEIRAEEKEAAPEAEPETEILMDEVPAQEEVEDKSVQVLPEAEVEEEVLFGVQPEEAETEIQAEENETAPEAEPEVEILTDEMPAQEEVEDETTQVLPEAEHEVEVLVDLQPEEAETVIQAEEEETPEAEPETEILTDEIPAQEETENEVSPVLPEREVVSDAKPEEAEAIEENEENSELEMIEGSLNDFMKEAKMTGYKKPGTEVLARLEEIKSFGLIPKILFEINLVLSKEPDNPQKLASVIIKEQGITTKILSVANSPYYGLQKKVTSIEYALMLLGREEVCRLVTALSLSDAVRFPSTPNLKYLDYWFHSMVVGFTSRDIAEKLGFTKMLNEVFLGGIFHDLGIQILAKHFPKEFEEIVQKIKNGENSLDAEMDLLDCTHQEIGRYAVEKWGLPADIYDALNCHHNPMLAEDNKILAGIINLADWMTHQVTQNESFWEKGLDLESNNYKLLGFKSIEIRNEFLEQYYPTLRATMQSVQF